MKQSNSKCFSVDFSLIELIAKLICFIVFPLYIINFGLDFHARTEAQAQNQTAYEKVVRNLEQIQYYSDNGRFVHHLLKSHYDAAVKTENPAQSFYNSVAKIKRAYAGDFFFIVADGQGNILPQYSDENSYRYLYRQAFEFISEAKLAVESGSQNFVGVIANLDQRIRRLQNLLGIFMDQNRLLKPLLADRSAAAAVASPGSVKHGVWYNAGDALSVISFVSRDFMRGNAGARWIVDKLNAQNSPVSYGVSIYPFRQNSFYPALESEPLAEATRALGLFEMAYPEQFIDINQSKFVCQLIDQKIRAFASIHQDNLVKNNDVKLKSLRNIFRYALLLALAFSVAYFTRRLRFGVELKLAGLFLYSVLIPGLVVAVFAYRDIQERENNLVMEAQANGLKLLQRIDAEFPLFVAGIEQKLNEFLAKRAVVRRNEFVAADYLEATTNELLSRFRIDSMLLVGADGKSYIPESFNKTLRNPALLHQVGRDIARIYGSDNLVEDIETVSPLSLQYAASYLYDKNRIRYLGMGEADFYAFSTMFQFDNDRSQNTASIIIWEMDTLQKMFIENYTQRHAEFLRPVHLAAYSAPADDVVFPDSTISGSQLLYHFRQLQNKHYVFSDNLSGFHLPGSVGCFMRGTNLTRFYLGILTSRQNIADEYSFFALKTLLLITIIFMVVVIAFSQLRWAIMTPIGALKSVLRAVERRDFRYRIDVTADNELGAVARAFNSSLETLQELELASTVQETLLPEPEMTHGKISVSCFTSSMTSLEGDFYETIKVDDNSLCVFIGDSTGHGVPASLNMAMAKAVAVDACERGFNIESFLLQLNHVFCSLRTSGSKDYMTGQSVLFDVNIGSFSLYNAGHCFPLLVKAKGADAWYLKSGGLPLGFREPFQLKPSNHTLEPGDTLIFYTDGIVESLNIAEIPFGFDRFKELAVKSWHQNTQIFLATIMAEIDRWGSSQQDDITIILCRFSHA